MSGRPGTRPDTRSDAGETLVEVLVTVVILGLAGTAVTAGLALSAKASDIHHKETTGSASVKNYAEAIQSYVSTHQAAFNCTPDYSAATVGFTPPSGFTPSYSWSALSGTGTSTGCTSNTAQLLTLMLASSDGRATERLALVLRRPCSGDQTVAATSCA